MNEPQITLTGHLGSDPKLRYTPNGTPVADLRVATTPRRRIGEDWVDGETLWFDVSVWKGFAENVCASLKKGDRVTVVGRLAQSTFVREDGSAKVKLGVEGATIAADLSRFPLRVIRPTRENAAEASFGHRYNESPDDTSDDTRDDTPHDTRDDTPPGPAFDPGDDGVEGAAQSGDAAAA